MTLHDSTARHILLDELREHFHVCTDTCTGTSQDVALDFANDVINRLKKADGSDPHVSAAPNPSSDIVAAAEKRLSTKDVNEASSTSPGANQPENTTMTTEAPETNGAKPLPDPECGPSICSGASNTASNDNGSSRGLSLSELAALMDIDIDPTFTGEVTIKGLTIVNADEVVIDSY